MTHGQPSTTPRPISQRNTFGQVLKRQKWATLIALPVLIYAMLNDIYFLWGLLFVYWGFLSFKDGQAFLLEPIDRREDPALYWITMTMWIGSGMLYIYADFASIIWPGFAGQ